MLLLNIRKGDTILHMGKEIEESPLKGVRIIERVGGHFRSGFAYRCGKTNLKGRRRAYSRKGNLGRNLKR